MAPLAHGHCPVAASRTRIIVIVVVRSGQVLDRLELGGHRGVRMMHWEAPASNARRRHWG